MTGAADGGRNGSGRARAAAAAVIGGRGRIPEPGARGEGEAPANVALVKYWGKRDEELKLPVTGSLSVSLGPLGTRTAVARAEDGTDADEVWLNGRPVATGEGFARRLGAYLDLTRPERGFRYRVETWNKVPTAAGLASSASGFAALARALDGLWGWGLGNEELSVLARLGSGSAARSLERGFVEWVRGERADGADSVGRKIGDAWEELRVGAVVADAGEKAVGSGEGMRRTVETACGYAGWPERVEEDLAAARAAIARKDVAALGEVAEGNALAMHGLMWEARPPLVYQTPETLNIMRRVWAARKAGIGVWLTMDAGPNVKLLFEADDEPRVRDAIGPLTVIRPGAIS